MLSVMADLGNLRALNDAGQVEETFLGHENLLISFDFGERFWKEIQIIDVICCVVITCDSEPGHHLGERVGVDLTLVQP